MKTKIILGLLMVSLTGSMSAALYSETFTVTGGAIPDGNPVGVTFGGTVNDVIGTISGLTVGLDMSGGYNGDLYAYLVAPNGTSVLLLNRPGTSVFGAPGAGFTSFTFDDLAAENIQTANEPAGVQFSGTYQAAGSLIDFNGGNANGTWTLFLADLSSGGGESTVNNWSLEIQAVPEPVNMALVVFGIAMSIVVLKRSRRGKQFLRSQK